MTKVEFEKSAETITALVGDLFEVGAIYRQGDDFVFSLAYRYAPISPETPQGTPQNSAATGSLLPTATTASS